MPKQEDINPQQIGLDKFLSLTLTVLMPIAGWLLGQQMTHSELPGLQAVPQATYPLARVVPNRRFKYNQSPPLAVVPFNPPDPPEKPMPGQHPAQSSHGDARPLLERLNQADGLGGELSLATLHDEPIPAAVRAEQLEWKRSGDPLAALPARWRQALRLALNCPPDALLPARVVVLPVPQLRESIAVPLALRGTGDSETFVTPRSPQARQALEAWVATQAKPGPGKVEAVLVQLEPLVDVSPTTWPGHGTKPKH